MGGSDKMSNLVEQNSSLMQGCVELLCNTRLPEVLLGNDALV